MPVIGEDDVRENNYIAKLNAIWSDHGLALKHDRDLASLDGGLQLYSAEKGVGRRASQTRIWFQAKSKRTMTVSAAKFAKSGTIGVRVSVDHVRFWYASPEPVYLIVYVESVSLFLAEDVREIVDRQWVRPTFYEAIAADRGDVTLKVQTSSRLDEAAVTRMLRHRSMRIDGPAFRGRPLGHRFDPLRSELKPLPPDLFDQLVTRILRAHDFRGDTVHAAPASASRFSSLRIVSGRFFQTLEWQWPLATAFGVSDDDDDFRTEAPLEFVHGDCLVIVEASPFSHRPTEQEGTVLVNAVRSSGCKRAIVFVNNSEEEGFARWRGILRPLIHPDAGCQFSPIALGSMSFMVLVASMIYLEFAPQLRWHHVNYL